ncbi:hypothetical protein SS1G_12810 [Sclerotinia sclerotiorum 1980 UF-70]|uniref:F-box domain-containing protein n=1 Tax=Sclerotinia sclerotiorum (strain ATCC 18683 / 1980 / Ss-1) TaxID=665079 RepID=A7F5D3_SCLS1|nr:hypothetical protein SS1G_12810 [Sclerotinia sclerotiorum 1980 UF-70]EDN97954.1 hypothetical protein SS1G_12810 [Sclerotinia sclerotiorum 1980 UF-70]
MTIGDAASTSKDVGLDGGQMEEYSGFVSSQYTSVPAVGDASRCHNLHAASDLVTPIDDTALDPPFLANPWKLPQLEPVPDEEGSRDKGKEVERGRTLERSPRYSNPLAKAESRPQRNKTTIEVDGRSIRTRDRSQTLHENPNDPCAIFDDQVLEPLIGIAQQDSFSEVLSGHASPASLNGSLDAKELKGRLRSRTSGGSSLGSTISPIESLTRTVTTVYNDSTPVFPDPTLPVESSSCRLPSVDRLEESARQSTSFTFSKLPTEIIQQIYDYLTPADFNSARHTCRTWFFTSIERSLLENMIRRGGWESSCQQEISETKCAAFKRSPEYDWFMSKRISRECALGPNWTGRGVPVSPDRFPLESKQSSFSSASMVDFTEVAVQYKDTTPAGTIFTVSSCGKFLMAANGCLIYVYELNRSHHDVDDWYEVQPGSLRPVTSIICPHRVLACSMDTSSHRYAIAALLDGRMGLVCDISLSNIAPPTSSEPGTADLSSQDSSRSDLSLSPRNDTNHGVSFLDRVSLDSSAPVQRAGRSTTAFVFPGIATTRSGGSSPGVAQRPDYNEASRSASAVKNSYPPEETGPHSVGAGSRMRSRLPARKKSNLNTREMPVETGTRSIYRNLCSEDDPPRSVAICPQRRCVAFGCSAGIELHWVDALTGQDLNRWFPLTAPSDFLFFLPPRKSIDSAKKLRLISTQANVQLYMREHMEEDHEVLHFGKESAGMEARGTIVRKWNMLSRYWHQWEGFEVIPAEGSTILIIIVRYHLVMVIISYLLIQVLELFAWAVMHLSEDLPNYFVKFGFREPEGRGSPTVYAGGADLRWGVRVVAAFGKLYRTEYLDVLRSRRQSSVVHKRSISKNSKNMQWLDWWPDEGLQAWLDLIRHPVPGILPGSMWPVRIKGQRIGTCSNIVDLAIDSSNGITIWAFSTDGIAKIWHLEDGKHRDLARLSVLRDGTIRENDYEGDIELNGTFLTSEILQHRSTIEQQSFDGTMSPDISTIITARRGSGWSYQSVNYDSDGDVVMEDVYGPGVDMPATWSRPERVYEEGQPVQDQQYQYLMSRWPRSAVGYRRWWERAAVSGDMARVVEARGVTRIEIEIR